jgi:hypothetical protein
MDDELHCPNCGAIMLQTDDELADTVCAKCSADFYRTFGPGPRSFPSRIGPRPFSQQVFNSDPEAIPDPNPQVHNEELLDIALAILGRPSNRRSDGA